MGPRGMMDELRPPPLDRQDLLDLESVLSTEAGRRVYYRLINVVGQLEVVHFAAGIKEGFAMALHDAFARGYQLIATCMAAEIEDNLPDRWEQLMIEKIHYDRERRGRKEQEKNQ